MGKTAGAERNKEMEEKKCGRKMGERNKNEKVVGGHGKRGQRGGGKLVQMGKRTRGKDG